MSKKGRELQVRVDECDQSGDETGKDQTAVLLADAAVRIRCPVGGQQKINHLHLSERKKMLDHLDAEILNELIDKIVMHHREETSDGQVIQQIEIYYRYIGKIEAYPAATAA